MVDSYHFARDIDALLPRAFDIDDSPVQSLMTLSQLAAQCTCAHFTMILDAVTPST